MATIKLSEDSADMTKMQSAIARGWLTAKKAGERCGISARAMLALAKSGEITRYKFGHKTIRFKLSDVENFIEKAQA
jgi:excisionase family DNA binding protein